MLILVQHRCEWCMRLVAQPAVHCHHSHAADSVLAGTRTGKHKPATAVVDASAKDFTLSGKMRAPLRRHQLHNNKMLEYERATTRKLQTDFDLKLRTSLNIGCFQIAAYQQQASRTCAAKVIA